VRDRLAEITDASYAVSGGIGTFRWICHGLVTAQKVFNFSHLSIVSRHTTDDMYIAALLSRSVSWLLASVATYSACDRPDSANRADEKNRSRIIGEQY